MFWLLNLAIENSQLSNCVIKNFQSLPRKIFDHWPKIFNDLINGGLISTNDLAIEFFWSLSQFGCQLSVPKLGNQKNLVKSNCQKNFFNNLATKFFWS
jgi:hypothetical protein